MRKIFPITVLVILLLISVSVNAENITTITDLYDFSDVGEGKITEDIILPNKFRTFARKRRQRYRESQHQKV